METTEPIVEERKKRSFIKPLAILILFLAILGLLFYFKALFLAATVDGKPISRFEVIKRAETKSGAEALNALIDRALIENEANKKGFTVNNDEVEQEIKNIEARIVQQGSTLSEALTSEGLSLEDLRSQIYVQKLVEKILKDKIAVTDQEIEIYIAENETTAPEGQDAQFRTELKEQLVNQKLGQEYTAWIEDLRSKAKIRRFIQYGTN